MSLNSCSTTALTAVWKDSAYQGGPMKKVLVIGVFKEQNIKRFFEDEFARQLKPRGVDAVPSYTVFPEEDILDKTTITEKMKELKMDSVLVTRVADVEDVTGYDTYPTHVDPGGDFYDYYVMCSGRNPICAESNTKLTLLPTAISRAWPSKPKPVTSVAACTSNRKATWQAVRFRVHMDSMAASTESLLARSCFRAVPITPVPRRLVRTSRSPGRAPTFFNTRRGSMRPVTA